MPQIVIHLLWWQKPQAGAGSGKFLKASATPKPVTVKALSSTFLSAPLLPSIPDGDPRAFGCPGCGSVYDCEKRAPVHVACAACDGLVCRKCAEVGASHPDPACVSCGSRASGPAHPCFLRRDVGVLMAIMASRGSCEET